MDLTVAICAYNAEQRIGMALEPLGRQVVPAGLEWEVLVVDNASTDGTSRVAQEMGRKWNLPLRVLHEPTPGLAHARRKAALEARSEVLSFLDDDTVPDENWVAACVQFMRAHPAAGIVGAKVMPLFEDAQNVPADFWERYAGLLSMYDGGDLPRRLDAARDSLPVGAGMTGRSEIFRFVFDELGSVTVGRTGTSLAGGEDMEAILIGSRLGWEIWYSPSLCLRHFVPTRKLTADYYDKWMVDTASCHAWLETLRGSEPERSRLGCAMTWGRYQLMGMKYRLLEWSPIKVRPAGHDAAFWKRFYRSKAAGWMGMLKSGASVRSVKAALDTNHPGTRQNNTTRAL